MNSNVSDRILSDISMLNPTILKSKIDSVFIVTYSNLKPLASSNEVFKEI